jgi:hypothetical protein
VPDKLIDGVKSRKYYGYMRRRSIPQKLKMIINRQPKSEVIFDHELNYFGKSK